MLRECYKNEIAEILEALKNCVFDDLDEYNFEYDVVDNFEQKYKKNFIAENGATKGVLIFNDFGFVIKIPFIYCDGEELYGAKESEYGWDYCEQEANRYQKANEAGFGDVFLETEYLENVNGHPIYIQQLAEVFSHIPAGNYVNTYKKGSDEDKSTAETINNNEHYQWIDLNWEADFLANYGIDLFRKFKQYLLDNKINDLRNDNIGYVGKMPVLIDYAGFND